MARRAFGSYMLEERLAVGGMGELFLASTSADRPLSVVKILHRDFLENEEFVAMFEDEGRIGSRLAHPNIVGVHDTGKVGEVPFIVFEFIDGENLRTVIKACAEARMPVPPEIAVRIVVGVLLGLDHAHRARDDRGRPMNLVHRDLSPDNIVISWDGESKILDFGIAKADGRSTQTQVGILKGKSQYMAPEQAKLGLVDQRSDLYSAGLVLLELLAGRKRFEDYDPVQQILAAQEWTAYKPSDYAPGLPVEIDAICLKALARAPENRFQSADEFAAALTRVLQQSVLPRSEPIASFLRRLFPNRVKRAGVANDEQTLHPRAGGSAQPTAARTPAPTVAPRTPAATVMRKPPAGVAPSRASEEATATRTATGPGSEFEDGETRASPAWDDGATRATASALPLEDETDERTRAGVSAAGSARGGARGERDAARPPTLEEFDTSTERAPVRTKFAPPPQQPPPTASPGARPQPFADEVTSDNERPTTRASPVRRDLAAERSTTSPESEVPPPIIRPPGSTPRPGTGTGAFKLDIGVEEGVYEYDEEFAPPQKPDPKGTKAGTGIQPKKKKKSRRIAAKLLLFIGLLAAGLTAGSVHRETLESVPQIAGAMKFAREKLGMPPAEADPLEMPVVIGTAGVMATPDALAPGTPAADATPDASATATAPPVLATPEATPENTPVATVVETATPAATPAAAVTKTPKPNAARPLSASIRVTSDPSGFPILLDGNPTGKKTPATILIAPGDHVVSVEAPGYRPWEYEDFFTAGDTKTIPAALIPE